jgi:hypothetical protein
VRCRMSHVSLLLYGALEKPSSRSPASAVLSLFIGTATSFASLQYGVFLARYIAPSSAEEPDLQEHSANRKQTISPENDMPNVACAPTTDAHTLRTLSCNIYAEDRALAHSTAAGEQGDGREVHRQPDGIPPVAANAGIGGMLIPSAAALVVTVGLCLGAGIWQLSHGTHEWAAFWFSGVLAPGGALLRWKLSSLNAKTSAHLFLCRLPRHTDTPSCNACGACSGTVQTEHAGACPTTVPWLPLGTLIANLLACTVGYVLLTLQHEMLQSRLAAVAIEAIASGCLGSLSTASTWAAEVC